MSRPGRKWIELGVPAGVSVILAASVGALTNIVTAKWNWPLGVTLGAVVAGAAGFEIWKSQNAKREARKLEDAAKLETKDAIELAAQYKTYLKSFRDEIGAVLTSIDKANDTRLPIARRHESRGQGKNAVLGGLRKLIEGYPAPPDAYLETDRQLRMYILDYVAGPPRSLVSNDTPLGRDNGDTFAEYTEETAEGTKLLQIMDSRKVHLVDRFGRRDVGLARIFAEPRAAILAPVSVRRRPAGLLVVETPSANGLSEQDGVLAGLYAQLASFVMSSSNGAQRRNGER